jgi:hypothetical protein
VLVASATPGGTMTDEESGSNGGLSLLCVMQLMYRYISEFVIDPYNARETLAIWTEGNIVHVLCSSQLIHYYQTRVISGFQRTMLVPTILEVVSIFLIGIPSA